MKIFEVEENRLDGLAKELWRNLHVTDGVELGGKQYLQVQIHWTHAPLIKPALIKAIENHIDAVIEITLIGGFPANETLH